MPVQVWVGEKPEHPNERRAIMALAQGLERLDGLYLILANFSVTGNNIDLVIIKHDAVFIVELKHCDGRVFGGVNGPWFVESANGERKRLNPGRKNPYNQVIAYFYALTNFLNERRRDFLSAQKTNSVDFRTCKRVVVIGPRIQEGSKIELDWKVELRGLDELPVFLVTERSSEIELTDEEMEAIPQLLGCTRWMEINNLLAGVLPNLDEVDEQPAPATVAPGATPAVETAASPTAAPAPVPQVPVASSAPANAVQRMLQRLRLTTGRLALMMSTLALVLLFVFMWRPGQPAARPPEGVPIAAITPGAVSAPVLAGSPAEAGCTWSGAQPVGKRWNLQTQEWVNVGLNDTASTALAEVIVTLEQVAYCSDEIKLTLSVKNNSSQDIELPLRSDNISIEDYLGNQYQINESNSAPTLLKVAPGKQERGIAIVDRPLSQNASSLTVRLKDKPFGAASWLVPLAGN